MSKSPTILLKRQANTSVKFNDSLQANTTYSMNFGESIEDNNEGNPYRQFKYVFSTGSYWIHSLWAALLKMLMIKKQIPLFP